MLFSLMHHPCSRIMGGLGYLAEVNKWVHWSFWYFSVHCASVWNPKMQGQKPGRKSPPSGKQMCIRWKCGHLYTARASFQSSQDPATGDHTTRQLRLRFSSETTGGFYVSEYSTTRITCWLIKHGMKRHWQCTDVYVTHAKLKRIDRLYEVMIW